MCGSLFVHKKSRRDHCETSIKGSIDPDRMRLVHWLVCFLISILESTPAGTVAKIALFLQNVQFGF